MMLGVLIVAMFIVGLILILTGWPSPSDGPHRRWWIGVALIIAGWVIKLRWYE
jgi:uncharacterized membrane protein YdcZ (DUF606 family)